MCMHVCLRSLPEDDMRWHTVIPTVVTLGALQLGFDGIAVNRRRSKKIL